MKYLIALLLTASIVTPGTPDAKPVVNKALQHRIAKYNRIMEAKVPCDIKAKDLLFLLEAPDNDTFYSDTRNARLITILGEKE